MKSMKPLMLLAAVVLAGAALAQDQGGPPPPGDQGGPPSGMRQGGPGRMRRGGPMMGPALLHMKEVQKELNLSDDQISQIDAAFPRPEPRSFGQDQTPTKRLTREEAESKLKSILHDDQFTRFHQIELQAEGPRAFTNPDVKVKLGLTSDQDAKIRSIMEADRRPAPQAGGNGEELGKALKERREKIMGDLAAVLTDDQKTTWKSMVGAKFDFPAPPRMHPGGMGGPGGGPPPPPADGGAPPPPPAA